MNSRSERLKIIIDTREKRPWAFGSEYADTRVETLRTGDYAIDGDELFAIERKSLDDFLSTISTGWERFQREIDRMEVFVAKVVIVESDFESCCFISYKGELLPPAHAHFKLVPSFIAKRIAQLTLQGVSVIFAGNVHLAAGLALKILMERNNEITVQS